MLPVCPALTWIGLAHIGQVTKICSAILFVSLSACAEMKSAVEPIYITSPPPEIPSHCDVAQKPSLAEPKLKPNQDATDIDAAKDREAWKKAFRTEKSYRKACSNELKVLLPQQRDASRPTS